MAAKRTKAQELDRVRHRETGETGTIMLVHDGQKGHCKVFNLVLDTGPRERTLWQADECEWAPPGAKRRCFRCGEETHWTNACPYGDCGAHLTEEAREVLRGMGLDPRRIPGRVDAPDAYDGIRLMYGTDHHDVYQPLRRRVCEFDGHLFEDGTCGCGATEEA